MARLTRVAFFSLMARITPDFDDKLDIDANEWALALEYLDTNGDNMVSSGELTQLFGTLEIEQ